MLDPKRATTTKVAIFASSDEQRRHLQTMLEKNGLSVAVSETTGGAFVGALNQQPVDVMLIDLDENDDDDDLDFLDEITEKFDTPLLFNDSGPEGVNLGSSNSNWSKKLAEKLTDMANEAKDADQGKPSQAVADEQPFPVAPPKTSEKQEQPAAVSTVTPLSTAVDSTQKAPTAPRESPAVADELNVWVLGASLGGPQAVRQFLSAIDGDLPVVFILAQHIGANHVSLLAEQLNRVTAFTVIPGKTGHQLQHGQVILTPADKQLAITDDGFLALTQAPPATIYSPSIDNVMTEVARRYGKKAGTIVFSGMGDDGARGCESIAEHGGIVWAQDIASCVVSSMPDQARKTGKVSYSAAPEQLARHLFEYYKD
ncbi:MAG: chemotaxis protein CheB [Gammaproteobacteria bacterium]|jgi:chemosensory pili system protein ChpB (putative protein-glutamate methylesterase)